MFSIEYLLSVSLREPEVLARLRIESLQQSMTLMLLAPEQGQFMALLVQLPGALNQYLHADHRVQMSLLPVVDGLTPARNI
jgi:predicted O-methyltransferase YrrM